MSEASTMVATGITHLFGLGLHASVDQLAGRHVQPQLT